MLLLLLLIIIIIIIDIITGDCSYIALKLLYYSHQALLSQALFFRISSQNLQGGFNVIAS